MAISYTVGCSFADAAEDVPKRWLAWLRDEHIADVMQAGVVSAQIVAMDADIPTFEVRYRFPDRATFDTYVSEHAPRLRDEGLRKFPLELGLSYSRTVGELTDSFGPG